jgi:hypothetical protein
LATHFLALARELCDAYHKNYLDRVRLYRISIRDLPDPYELILVLYRRLAAAKRLSLQPSMTTHYDNKLPSSRPSAMYSAPGTPISGAPVLEVENISFSQVAPSDGHQFDKADLGRSARARNSGAISPTQVDELRRLRRRIREQIDWRPARIFGKWPENRQVSMG